MATQGGLRPTPGHSRASTADPRQDDGKRASRHDDGQGDRRSNRDGRACARTPPPRGHGTLQAPGASPFPNRLQSCEQSPLRHRRQSTFCFGDFRTSDEQKSCRFLPTPRHLLFPTRRGEARSAGRAKKRTTGVRSLPGSAHHRSAAMGGSHETARLTDFDGSDGFSSCARRTMADSARSGGRAGPREVTTTPEQPETVDQRRSEFNDEGQ